MLLAGRYELGVSLGAGGMARVHAAHDRLLDRRVAVKLIHPMLLQDPVNRKRFVREAQATAALHHPNTVAVFDYGESDDQPFIVMELVDGPSLADTLRAAGKLTAAETIRIGSAVLLGLAAAHSQKLVHRDIKPSNILLLPDGGVKLADFGIATAPNMTLTATGHVVGTLRYLPPECVNGQRANEASDLYSLGAVLYECLAGRPPFEADTLAALAVAHRDQPVPRLTDVAPATPRAVAMVVEKALSKSPGDRYSGSSAMRGALARAGSGKAAATKKPEAHTRVRRREAPTHVLKRRTPTRVLRLRSAQPSLRQRPAEVLVVLSMIIAILFLVVILPLVVAPR